MAMSLSAAVAVALVVDTPTTNVWYPAIAAAVIAAVAYGRAVDCPPGHEGSPSVASKMYLGFGSVGLSFAKYTTGCLMAWPVGVPLPLSVVAEMASVTALPFIGAISMSILSVTLVATHAAPSPSGNVLRPHETSALVWLMTSLRPGTTRLHFDPVPPWGGSSIDADLSSTSSTSAGLRITLNSLCPQLSAAASLSPLVIKPVVPPAPVPVVVLRPPVVVGPLLPALPPARVVPSPADEHAQSEVVAMSEMMAEDTLTTSPRRDSLHGKGEPLVRRPTR